MLPSAAAAVLAFAVPEVRAQTYYWNPSIIQTYEAQKAWNWTESNIQSNAPRNYPASDKDDNFTSATLDAANWAFIDSVKDGFSSYSLTAIPGQLSLSARGDDLWTIEPTPGNFVGQNKIAALWRKKAYKGNFDVSVKVVSQTNTHAWAKAGIIAWNDTANATLGGAFSVESTPGNGYVEHYDSKAPQGYMDEPQGSNGTTVYPHWLRMVKQGTSFTAYYRTDSLAAWTKIRESRIPLATADSSFIGLFVTAHTTTATSTVVFDNFRGGGNVLPSDLDLRFGTTSADNATLAAPLAAKSVEFTGYTGAFSFGNSTLSVSGNATFSSTMGIIPGTGKLILNGTSGTQNLTPKANDTLPAIQKTGAGEVVVLANPLKADSLHIAAGTFDLNSNSAYLQQFTAAGGAGILEGFTAADDSLVIFSRADFNGLGSLLAGLGTVALKSIGNGKNVAFNPADKPFNRVTLWTVPTGTSDARVQVGPGHLILTGNLEFRNQRAAANFDGEITFQPSNPNVTVGGNITQVSDGTGDNWQVVRMGNGLWKATGNVGFPLDGGSADNSVLELTGTGIQTLAVPGGALNVVKHTGSGEVQLTAAFAADSLLLTAGLFNLNGNNITLAGDLVVDGAPDLLKNLGGRSINVGGNAQLKGRSGALLALDPGTAWNIAVAGSFTAEYAKVANSNASGGSTGQADANSTDGGSNINWSFNGGPITQIPSIIGEPKDTTVIEGQNASFTASSSGGGLTFAWERIGTPGVVGMGAVLNLNNVTLAQNGQLYRCIVSNTAGKDTTREAKLTVKPKPVPAKVTTEPLDRLVEAGTGATFTVAAEGDAPITYAWFKKGVTSPVGNAKDLALTGLTLADSGAHYYCIVENAFGKDTTREALLEVVPKPVPARITAEPKDSTVFVTAPVSFTAAAEGTSPLAFRWQRKGDTASLGSDPVLSFASAKLSDDGLYICIVSNAYGKDTTREAKLTVKPAPVAPTIVREPADTLVKVGGKAAFSAGVLGTSPLAFEWRKAGDTAVLSKDSVFTIASATEDMSGNSYYVVVSNGSGQDTSSQARLTVRSCDSLTVQVSAGQTANEEAAVKIWGKAVCADRIEWSVVSGPAPRLLDPGVDTLAFKAPRVAGDTAIVYLFSAWFGETQRSQQVRLAVKEAIPDPSMGISASQVEWSGAKPLVVRPQVFNKAQLDLFTGYPLRYVWTLEPAMADSTQKADSLSLASPSADGRMDVILCLDNGGKPACDTVHVDIDRTPVALRPRGTLLGGSLLVAEGRISWLKPGLVRVWSWQGRLLFEARGREGSSALLSPEAHRALRGRAARLIFTPAP